MTTPAPLDPFDSADKSPALSFDKAPYGTAYTGIVTDWPKLLQSNDFNTGDPAFWPLKAGQTTADPKMAVVVNMTVDGEPRSVWAQKPSALFAAIVDAQKAAGGRIEPGGQLTITLTGEKPHTDPEKIRKKQPQQKLYSAAYKPLIADAFATDPPPF